MARGGSQEGGEGSWRNAALLSPGVRDRRGGDWAVTQSCFYSHWVERGGRAAQSSAPQSSAPQSSAPRRWWSFFHVRGADEGEGLGCGAQGKPTNQTKHPSRESVLLEWDMCLRWNLLCSCLTGREVPRPVGPAQPLAFPLCRPHRISRRGRHRSPAHGKEQDGSWGAEASEFWSFQPCFSTKTATGFNLDIWTGIQGVGTSVATKFGASVFAKVTSRCVLRGEIKPGRGFFQKSLRLSRFKIHR